MLDRVNHILIIDLDRMKWSEDQWKDRGCGPSERDMAQHLIDLEAEIGEKKYHEFMELLDEFLKRKGKPCQGKRALEDIDERARIGGMSDGKGNTKLGVRQETSSEIDGGAGPRNGRK